MVHRHGAVLSKGRESWDKYIAWSGLRQPEEGVSLDGMLCPRLLRDVKDEYWPHIVTENFTLDFFLNFDFLMTQVEGIEGKNVLCVF